jgi:N-acetylmuramoyl-L-alanine amidase
VKQAPFYVLAGARMPAVLVEVGFISNEGEAERLRAKEYQEKVAAALADGIAVFRKETRASRR